MIDTTIFLATLLILSMGVTGAIGTLAFLRHRWVPFRIAGLIVAMLSISIIAGIMFTSGA